MTRYGRRARFVATALAALAGFVDAIGFLKLGGFFVSFMSGNTTRLAIGVSRSTSMAAMGATLILSFLAGVIAGSLLAEAAGTRRKSAVLLLAAALLALAAALGLDRMLGLMALPAAMGASNAVFQSDGEVSIGVTYMTGTLVKVGQRIAGALRGHDRLGWLPYLTLWLGLLTGGVAGAAAFPHVGLSGLWIAAAAYLALALVAPRASPIRRASPISSPGS